MQHNQHIVELAGAFAMAGVGHVVVCPGSRNAPLIQAFTGNPSFRCLSIVDERSAAYAALGMARESGRPVAVVTTSGTAVLNLLPAVAEAFYQGIPLVLVTADRPLEKISNLNNQWIDQEAPFYNYTRGFLQLPPDVYHPDDMRREIRHVRRLLSSALDHPMGPVHLNVLIEEPLYEKLPGALEEAGVEEYPEPGQAGEIPTEFPEPGEKILVLAGMGRHGRSLSGILTRLAESGRAVVVAENLANLSGEALIRYPELCIRAADGNMKEDMVPDTVIGFGGQVVSKQLGSFLRSLDGPKYVEVAADPLPFLEFVQHREMQEGSPGSTFPETWKKAEQKGIDRAFHRLRDLPFGNLSAVYRILAAVPAGWVVHLGNSATVRYSQVVPVRDDLTFFSNRGTSGIDGCVSTAVGAAMVSDRYHLLLVGDLSFVYDSNALWNKDFPSNLRIVVLNDSGGGIFRLLEGPARMPFYEEFSVTHHPVSVELLGQSFGRSARRAANHSELEKALAAFWEPDSGVSILEVDTAGSENSLIFTEYLNF